MKSIRILSCFILIGCCMPGITYGRKVEKIALNSVKITGGKISGKAGTDAKVLVFKGIPFAAPPVGEFRWKAPQPVVSWKGTKKCDTFGPSAWQNPPVPFLVYTKEFLIPAEPTGEDCLYLNVWTTATSTSDHRPVIVFIHGGAFMSGSGSVPIYNGESMAKKGIVFVTINYRVGIFGFFAHPELTKESGHQASGNYGILDQIAALKWVKQNISAFGGNPDNVTIAGQSAGSMSVNALAASRLAKGFFHRMIAESGASVVKGAFGGTESLATAEAKGIEIARTAGVSSIADLRNKPAAVIGKLLKGMGAVIVDGYVLQATIPEVFAKGELADVPLLTGWNGDDALFNAPATVASYREYLKNLFGSDAETIFKFYPASNDEEATLAQKQLSRDSGFGIQNYAWARMQAEKGKSKAFLYFFERKVPETGRTNQYGAFHTAEVPYAYDNLRFLNRPLEPADHELAKLISSYWVNFASTGDPNGAGLPIWPSFRPGGGETMRFNTVSSAGKQPNSEALEFLLQRMKK